MDQHFHDSARRAGPARPLRPAFVQFQHDQVLMHGLAHFLRIHVHVSAAFQNRYDEAETPGIALKPSHHHVGLLRIDPVRLLDAHHVAFKLKRLKRRRKLRHLLGRKAQAPGQFLGRHAAVPGRAYQPQNLFSIHHSMQSPLRWRSWPGDLNSGTDFHRSACSRCPVFDPEAQTRREPVKGH